MEEDYPMCAVPGGSCVRLSGPNGANTVVMTFSVTVDDKEDNETVDAMKVTWTNQETSCEGGEKFPTGAHSFCDGISAGNTVWEISSDLVRTFSFSVAKTHRGEVPAARHGLCREPENPNKTSDLVTLSVFSGTLRIECLEEYDNAFNWSLLENPEEGIYDKIFALTHKNPGEFPLFPTRTIGATKQLLSRNKRYKQGTLSFGKASVEYPDYDSSVSIDKYRAVYFASRPRRIKKLLSPDQHEHFDRWSIPLIRRCISVKKE